MFLSAPEGVAGGASGDSGNTAANLEFTESIYETYRGAFPIGYGINNKDRAWMPATSSGGASGQSGDSDTTEFDPGAPAPGRVHEEPLTVADIKTTIAWMTSDTSVLYQHCIFRAVHNEAYYRNYTAYYGTDFPTDYEHEVTSGNPAGHVLYVGNRHGPQYGRYWVEGDDAALFSRDIRDDDANPANGYQSPFTIKRPLAAGTYSVTARGIRGEFLPCNFTPESGGRIDYTITVTAPEGVLHEGFFDPVALTSGVGADGSNGTLTPTGFNVSGTSTSITGLRWESNSVVLTLSPHVSLSGQRLDFIELDGTVGLSLFASSSTVDSTAGTLTWSVTQQPWENGDQLMLRIGVPNTAITLEGLAESLTEGSSDSFTVSASDLTPTNSYSIRVTTDNSNTGFNPTCTDRQDDVNIPLDSTSYTATFNLHGCTAPGGTVTATLLQGTATVATDTQDVAVTDVNGAPIFDLSSYTFSVAEDASSGQEVGTLTASDPDADTLTYSITAGDPDGKFSIGAQATDSTMGDIVVAGSLDYETTSSYTLTVEVRDGDGETDTATVTVTVTDANDAPAFQAPTYSFSVGEDASSDDGVGTVEATDEDTGDTLTYSITAGDPDGKFSIGAQATDSTMGDIVVAGSLDYETTSSYTLTVEVSDGDGSTDTVTVTVAVTEVPAAPEVEISDLVASIGEGGSDPFSVTASNLISTDSYVLRVTTDNSNTGFDSACTDRQEDVTITLGGTTHTASLTLHGCTAPGGTVTATLLQGTTTIATDTADVMVQGVTSSNVTITLSPREGQFFTQTDITVSWNDPNSCVGSYFVAVYTGGGSLTRNLGFHPAPATTSHTADLGLNWDDVPNYDWTVQVGCSPSDWSNWTVVGEAPLQSGLPSP